MIRHVRIDDFVDSGSLQDVTQKIRDFESDDFDFFIDSLPPLNDLIRAIPRSLPLLDAIYTRCEKFDNRDQDVFRKQLECDQMLNRIIWWIAQLNQLSTVTVDNNNKNSPRGSAFQFSIVRSHIGSILGVLQRQNPEILDDIYTEKNQLNSSLEALGCHGLVNSNNGMIRLVDATLHENIRLYERIKGVISRLKDLQKQKFSFWNESLTKASHQRQLNLKLSEVFERLKQNEIIEGILDEILTNTHLLSLHRIVRKRVQADRTLINVFNSYNNTKPEGFQICEINPVVARVIVIFKNAYTQLTALTPMIEGSDSGYTHEGSESPPSEEDSPDEASVLKESSIIERSNSSKIKDDQSFSRSIIEGRFNGLNGTLPDDARWITLSIYSSPSEVDAVVEKFSSFFEKQKLEILEALNELNEFQELEDLQLKTMFSVVILTYRSVYESTQRQYRKIYDTMDYLNGSDVILDFSIYRLLYRQAKTDHGMTNARDVTTQIWETLYDFPSLKTCTRFNRFILDCVDVIWDLVAGIDGRLPRIKIDYECHGTFDESRHIKYESSSSSPVIKQYLWPGLISLQEEKQILKAIVLT
ncbi:hypothetical protein FO519_004391 [Halicephalobus sp. NKZ332]|nr:hypothetical protein FO519_004391 [Halicephalobus sp. NKZ332]